MVSKEVAVSFQSSFNSIRDLLGFLVGFVIVMSFIIFQFYKRSSVLVCVLGHVNFQFYKRSSEHTQDSTRQPQ